jgi:hypothetical protein
MRILNFNTFLTEALGVAEASLTFIPFLKERIEKRFLYFLNRSDLETKYVENIRFNSIKSYIKDLELYFKFPVVGFDIEYEFVKYTDYDFGQEFPTASKRSPISIGGGAQSFGNKNWNDYSRMSEPQLGAPEGIILYLHIGVHVNEDSFDPTDEIHLDLLHEGLESTLYHEMNHFYELYYLSKRKMPGKSIKDRGYLNTSITNAGDNIYGISGKIVNYWTDNFLYYTYLCEDFELRSHVQEMDFYFKKHPQQSVQDSRVFKYYDQISKFDGDKFYNDMLGLIEIESDGDGEYIINKLKNIWISNYKKELKSYKNDEPTIPIKKLEKMSGYEFIKYWEGIFHEKGEYVKRKIYKLASSYKDVKK